MLNSNIHFIFKISLPINQNQNSEVTYFTLYLTSNPVLFLNMPTMKVSVLIKSFETLRAWGFLCDRNIFTDIFLIIFTFNLFLL